MVQSKHFVAFFLAAAAIANVAALPTPTTSQEIKHPIETVTGMPPAPGPTPLGEPQKNDVLSEAEKQARISEWVKTQVVLTEARKARAKNFAADSEASAKDLIKLAQAQVKARAPGPHSPIKARTL